MISIIYKTVVTIFLLPWTESLLNACISNECAHLQIRKTHLEQGFLFLTQQEAQGGIPEWMWWLRCALSLMPSRSLKLGSSVDRAPGVSLPLWAVGGLDLLHEGSQSEYPRRSRPSGMVSPLGALQTHRFTSAGFCSLRQSQRPAQVQGRRHVLCSTGGPSGNWWPCFKTTAVGGSQYLTLCLL